MASMDPSDDAIKNVADFAGLDFQGDRDMISRALKNNNMNAETVVMQYFDNPEGFRQKYVTAWDDTMFTSDREGTGNNTGISFHIESPSQNDAIQGSTPPPEGYAPGAPSRPPSRTNSRSPLGRAVDWAVGNQSGVPNSQAQEDEDMQRALRESAQEAGISMPQQESGVVDGATSSAYFGPANRSDYEQADWAMVPTAISETNFDSVPAPSSRQRAPGAPAFLVQGVSTSGNHRLGGLLTILHEIPLARNVLLECGSPASAYGHNSEWWKGQEILPPHVLAQLQTGELQWGQQDVAKPNFEEEIHRLMAFLDQTERSHGTVSVLADTMPLPHTGAEKQFYELLADRNREKLAPLTQVATIAQIHGSELGDEEARFGLLDIEHTRNDYSGIKTLYESIDLVMWSDVLAFNEVHEGSKMAMFRDTGEVLAIRLGGDGPADSIDIPPEFYPERYLETRKEEARRIQLAVCETKRALARLTEEEQALYEWRDEWSNKTLDKREVIKKAMDQWKGFREYLESLGRFQVMEESGFDTTKHPDYRLAPCQLDDQQETHHKKVDEVLQWANGILSDLEERMKALKAQLEQIQAKQRFLGKLLTVPDKPGRPKPMSCKRYLLRGVATPTDIVYVCRRAEPDLIDLDDAPRHSDQWWRLAYAAKDSEPVRSEKVEVERVLRDVWHETKTPLLIYATENALNTPCSPLSSPLERFVRVENKAFRQELSAEKAEAVETRGRASIETLSPSKRKHRADSMDSMDSNRASIGSEDRIEGDNPFADQDVGHATELMDLSTAMAEDASSAGMHRFPGGGERPGLPPAYNQAMADTTSATLTPATLMSEDLEGPAVNLESNTQPPIMKESVDEKPAARDGTDVDSRAPEMQERTRPPGLFTASNGGAESKDSVGTMDMEISDHHT
ncbi:hypothetical protein HJFPF1_11461 [Paramyrothecium foliicola]|nr:hypothetical protein HJFPF1_11461 [Paramyrothecium foliicola]